MTGWETEIRIVLEVLGAALLGGLIGVEREVSDKPAGLRTLMIVAAASAVLMNVGEVLEARYQTGLDPTRVIQAIVTGIAFLGAGTIIRRGREVGHIEGLTTAACILAAATIGICVAVKLYVLGGGLTLLTLLILLIFRRVEVRFFEHRAARDSDKTKHDQE
jgi:putative Mg2+ transporter-C (MgtC) family protein